MAAAALLYMKETTSQIKDSRINKILSAVGIREINNTIAETPEKFERYDHDRSGTVDIMQNIIKAHNNGLRYDD